MSLFSPRDEHVENVLQCASEWIELARCKSSSKLGLNFVSERYCVVARRGGEQLKENDQSEMYVNSIRPIVVASLLELCEA